ncbi:MAG: hypothetical protein KW802_04565, partial [Candidatus Doudnabacteria bacterium]|nr:hypothetical protein [Candidatus Doudnabacteria bacterium]
RGGFLTPRYILAKVFAYVFVSRRRTAMERRLIAESPMEYFRELVHHAMFSQHVADGGLGTYYLVKLLVSFVQPEDRYGETNSPLAIRLNEALQAGGAQRRHRLQALGDFSLFMSGFFSDTMKRRRIDLDYYVSMGRFAYSTLSQNTADSWAETFGLLADHFVAYMDVLSCVGDHMTVRSDSDLLRLYEKWLRTGSSRYADQLMERGIIPNSSILSGYLQ